MKFYYFYILFAIFSSINSMQGFNLTDDDLSALESFGLTQDQVEEFNQVLTSLTPEEQEELVEFSQKLEKDMKDKGLDPLNPDDYFKWAEQEEAAKSQQKTEEPAFPVIKEPKTTPIPVVENTTLMEPEKKNAKALLESIIQNLSDLKQKAYSSEYMNNKIQRWNIELQELIYFLHILTGDDLIKHLTSKDFSKLIENLEKFDNVLLRYLPQIHDEIIIEESENPYETLHISHNSNPQEIDSAYQKLKDFYSAESIESKLKEQNIHEKEIKKQIKSAKISLSFIDDAYNTLKDPKQKAMTDRQLREKIQQAQNVVALSNNAFDKALDIFSSMIFDILKDIQTLMKKYKPEELAKAKKQEEIEKIILAQTKQPKKVTPTRLPYKFNPENKHEAFWRQIDQEQSKRKNIRFAAPQSQKSQAPTTRAAQGPGSQSDKGQDQKKSGDTKGVGKGDSKKGGESKKETKQESKKSPEKKSEDQSKSISQSVEVSKIAHILDSGKEEIEGFATPKRNGPAEPKKIKLDEISKQVGDYLAAPISQDGTALKNLSKFVEENKIEQLWESATELKPQISKLDPTALKLWKDSVSKYEKRINEWHDKLSTKTLAHSQKRSQRVEETKKNFHSIDKDYKDTKDYKKKLKSIDPRFDKYPNLEKMNLGVLRKYIDDIKETFDAVNKAGN